MKLMNLEFSRIAHDTFRIQGSKVIYTDPFKVTKGDETDIVLISHEHFDHLSLEDLQKVTSAKTTLVASLSCKDGLKTGESEGNEISRAGRKGQRRKSRNRSCPRLQRE